MPPLVHTLYDCCLPPALSDPGQDVFCIELQEARLVIPRSMKDEVSETKLDVRTNLFQVLVWVVGDEPAAMRLVCHRLGLAFHLAWVLDAYLILGGKCQGCPDTRVAKR